MFKRNTDKNKLPVYYYEFRELVRKRLLHERITEVFYVLDKTQYSFSYNSRINSYEETFYYNTISHKEDWKTNPKVEQHEVNHKILFRLYGRGIIGILGTKKYMSGGYKGENFISFGDAGLDILKKTEQRISSTSKSINVSETVMWYDALYQKIIQVDVYWLDMIEENKQFGYPMTLKLTFENKKEVWISLIQEGINEMVDAWGTKFMTIYFSKKVQKNIIKDFDIEESTVEYFSSLAEIATHIDIIK